MLTRISLIIVILISLGLAKGQSQEITKPTPKIGTHSFGAGAGFSSGIGFSYRYWPNKYGFRVNFLPMKSGDITFVSAGLTGIIMLREHQKINLYGFAGGHMFYDNKDPFSILGAGTGFNFNLVEVLSIDFSFGYGYFYNSYTKIDLISNIGLYYKL